MPLAAIQTEVEARLKKVARTVKMDGFRPGKVPNERGCAALWLFGAVRSAERQGGRSFCQGCRKKQVCAWQVSLVFLKRKALQKVMLTFEAVFEVFPEVKIGDLAAAEVEKLTAEVDDAAIEKTLDILRSSAALLLSAQPPKLLWMAIV